MVFSELPNASKRLSRLGCSTSPGAGAGRYRATRWGRAGGKAAAALPKATLSNPMHVKTERFVPLRICTPRVTVSLPPLMLPGCRVRVAGLVAATHYNGLAGVIRSGLNSATARIGVMLDNGCGVDIKPANLTLLAAASGVTIRGVHGSGEFPGPGFTEVDVSADHAIFRQGELSPILTLCGIPLLVMRTFESPIQALAEHMRENNRPAQFIMGSPSSGFAPVEWMGGGCLPKIGEVTFVRQDRVPFTCLHLDVVWDFFMTTCDSFEDDPPPSRFCRSFFLRGGWCHRRHIDDDHDGVDDEEEEEEEGYGRQCRALVWYEDEAGAP